MRFCPECGSALKEHESTCRKCGAMIAARPDPAVSSKQTQRTSSLQGMITAQQKHTPFYGRSVLLFLLALLLFISGLLSWRFLIKPGLLYRKAEQLFDAGEFREAALIYGSIPGYQVSDEMAQLSWYREGQKQMDAGEYIQAYELFTKLRGLYDSEELADTCFESATADQLYDIVMRLIDSGDTETAYSYCRRRLFRICGDETIQQLYYLLQEGKWKGPMPEDRLEFGFYEQDHDPDNGPEPIEWIVAETDGNTVTLISRYVLETNCYSPYGAEDITWENSVIRAFLNDEFYHKAFSAGHRALILKTAVSQNALSGTVSDPKTVTDQIFIPCIQEAEHWFPDPADRICGYQYPYEFRKEQCQWWLRDTVGIRALKPYRAEDFPCACVDTEGAVSDNYAYIYLGIRPVIRIDLSALH